MALHKAKKRRTGPTTGFVEFILVTILPHVSIDKFFFGRGREIPRNKV
jgi:hypothetical protein